MAVALAAVREKPWQTTVYLGMILFIFSEVFLFGSLFSTYFYLASKNPIWPPEGVHLAMGLVSLNTILLLSSSFTMQWAIAAIGRGDRSGLIAGLLVTILLGGTFLSITGWEWVQATFRPWSHAYGSVFFTLTGFHATHVLGGILALTVLVIRAVRGRITRERNLAVEVVGLYWHFVDLVWIGVFTTLFIIQ